MNMETGIHKLYNRYTGDRRSEIKDYDKVYEYRGFKIKRNKYVPTGGENRIEVPELLHLSLGGEKKGFYTVSEIQARAAIDKWIEYNKMINK